MGHSALLLQLVVILATARVLGLVLRFFGQSSVIGEMAAGIVLGPVVFGAIAPELHAHVFEKDSAVRGEKIGGRAGRSCGMRRRAGNLSPRPPGSPR